MTASGGLAGQAERPTRRWAQLFCYCGIAFVLVGVTAHFWAVFGGHRLKSGVEYTWRGNQPVYLVGRSVSEDIERDGFLKFTGCMVQSTKGDAQTYEVEVRRVTSVGLYGTRIDPPPAQPATVRCEDATVTTGPIVYLYPFTGALETFGAIFAILGRVVGWPRYRPHFGKWNLHPS